MLRASKRLVGLLTLFFLFFIFIDYSSGAIYVWGNHSRVPLGISISQIPSYYVNGNVPKKVSLGVTRAFTLDSRNKLVAWGFGHFGNADGFTGTSVTIRSPKQLRWPSTVLPDGGTFDDVAVSAEGDFVVLLSATPSASGSRVFAFGQNNLGQTGTGSVSGYVLTPTPLVGVSKKVASVYAGKDYGVLLYADGTIGTFGSNEFGQLAINNLSVPFSNVVLSPNTAVKFAKLSVGSFSIAACSEDEKYYGWGLNDVGQVVTNGNLPAVPSPVTASNPLCSIETIQCITPLALRYQHYVVSVNNYFVYLGLSQGQSVSRGPLWDPFRCLEIYELDYVAPTRVTDFVGAGSDAFIMYQPTFLHPDRVNEFPAYFAEPDLFTVPDLTKPEVGAFMDYRNGQGLVSRYADYVTTGMYPFRAKILKQYVHQISGGTDYVSKIYVGISSAVVITNEGRMLTWTMQQPTPQSAPLTFLSDIFRPQLADPLAFLGSFEVVNVKAMKVKESSPIKVAGAVYFAKHHQYGNHLFFMGELPAAWPLYSRANVPDPLFGEYCSAWQRGFGLSIVLSLDDPWTVGGIGWVLVAPAALGRSVRQVWLGDPEILQLPVATTAAVVTGTANATHLAATQEYGYAIMDSTRLVRWNLTDIPDYTAEIRSVQSIFNFSAPVIHMDAGMDENVFVIDSTGSIHSFGNNLASDGTPGLLCDPSFTGANRAIPQQLSQPLFSAKSICVNGETVLALSTDGLSLYACGRNPWTGPGTASSDTTSWVYWRKVNLPPAQNINAFTCGHFGGAAILFDGTQTNAYSWGRNTNRESGTGDSSPIIWNPIIMADLSARYLADISLGWQFGAVATPMTIRTGVASAVWDPAETTYTVAGTSLTNSDATVSLTYEGLNFTKFFADRGETFPTNNEGAAQCSITGVSAGGNSLTCFPFLPRFPERQLSAILYDIMLAQNLTRVPISLQFSQLSRREYTRKLAWGEVILPRINTCARGADNKCVRLVQSDAREITLYGDNLGNSTSGVKILFRPSGGCEVKSANDTFVVCRIIGTFSTGQPLRAAAFRTNVPEVVSYWISFTPFVDVAEIINFPPVFNFASEIPWNSKVLTISGRNLTVPNASLQVKISTASCPVIESNSTHIVCNLTNVLDSGIRGPLRASLERDGSPTNSFLAAVLVDEPRLRSGTRIRTIASNSRSIRIDADGLGSSLMDLSVSILVDTGNKRRSALAVDSISCVLSQLDSNGVLCSLPPVFTLPVGALLNTSITRGSGGGFSYFLGQVVPPGSIQQSTKKVASNAPFISISGSLLAPEYSSGTLIFSDNSSLPCSIDLPSSNETRLVCRLIGTSFPNGPVSLYLTASGGEASPFPAVVGSFVPPPSITASSTSLPLTTSRFTIQVSGISSETNAASENLVFVTQDPSAQSLIPCVIQPESTAESLQCITSANFSSGNLFAIVESFGGRSNLAQIAALGDQAALTGSFPRDAIIGIAIGGAVFVIIVAISIVLLVRSRRAAALAARNRIDVPDDMRNLFNIRDSELEIETKLGEGSFGAVFLAKFKGEYVAVKKLSNSIMASQVNDFFRECSIMLSVPVHPNVVRLYGMVQELGNFGMVLEFLSNGSLDSWMAGLDSEELSPVVLHQLAIGIARGMMHLAENRIVHRDLAARNILLDSNLNPKVSDFGFSRIVGDDRVGKTATTVGPVRWMPPEAIGQLTYSQASDVWSYGCVLYELLERKEPFDGLDLFDVAQDIRDNGTSPLKYLTAPAPGYITELMGMCFQKTPDMRPSFKEIVEFLEEHPPKGAETASGKANVGKPPIRTKYQDMGSSNGSSDILKK